LAVSNGRGGFNCTSTDWLLDGLKRRFRPAGKVPRFDAARGARGELVDEAGLVEALKSGHVAGAAIDVFREEPATASPLFSPRQCTFDQVKRKKAKLVQLLT